MARFNQMDNGNPAEQSIKAKTPNVGRSAHDFSTSHAGNCLLGMLVPVDCFDVVPSENLQMSISAQVEFRNPTTRPLLNGFRTYFHVRYNRLVDLWEGAKNFIDHGRSGNIDLTLPNAIYHINYTNPDNPSEVLSANACTPMSLLNFLHLPVECLQVSIDNVNRSPLRQFQCAVGTNGIKTDLSNSTDFFPAPVLFAYQRNWRDFYSNKNLLQGNKYWFPDNEDHFILSYNCTDAVCINYEDEDLSLNETPLVTSRRQFFNLCGTLSPSSEQSQTTLEPNNPSVFTSSDNTPEHYAPNLSGIKFVQFRGDRFTTSSPFPDLIRGDTPILELTKDNFVNLVDKHGNTVGYSKSAFMSSDTPDTKKYTTAGGDTAFLYNNEEFSGEDDNSGLGIKFPSITMSDLYTLETLTAFKKKMGMTNGDYNESIKAQFGYDPKNHTREADYIGGFYIDMGINTVVQQSESSSTPLGTKAGSGLSAGSGNIGSFNVPDYGYISVYMFTVPNVYYTQGKPKMYSKKLSTDLYFPLFNNLPAQAIRNDELYVSGNPATDAKPFSYEDRYAEYKSRTNYVSGFMGLSPDVAVYDSAKIMARRFDSTPSFNHYFVSMVPENVDMSVFAMDDEPPLDFIVNVNVRRVFPGPYTAIEGSLSSPKLND